MEFQGCHDQLFKKGPERVHMKEVIRESTIDKMCCIGLGLGRYKLNACKLVA